MKFRLGKTIFTANHRISRLRYTKNKSYRSTTIENRNKMRIEHKNSILLAPYKQQGNRNFFKFGMWYCQYIWL